MRDARYDGDLVFPGELPEKVRSKNTCRESVTPAPRCPNCLERVTHRDESANGRAQHFAHCPDAESCGGGSGGGESDPHRWMKNIAEGHLRRILSTVSVARTVVDSEHVPAPVSEKESREPDVILEFEEHDEQLGDGLFVEAQWRHKDKDIPRTNDDYFALDRECAVLWIDEDDFDTTADDPEEWTCQIGSERRLRQLVRSQHWPKRAPKRSEWWEPSHTPRKEAFTNNDFNTHDRDVSVPATLAEPILDEIQYRESDCEAIFTGHAEDHFRTQAIAHGPTSTLPNPTMPPVFRDTIEYKNTEWERLFADYPENHYTTQASIPAVDSRKTIPATIIERWLDTRHYRTNSWAALFDNLADGFLTGLTATTPRVEILFPPEYAEKHREKLHKTWKLAGGNYDLDLLYRLKENNAPRRCADCGSGADYYLFEDGIVSEYRCEQHLLMQADAAAD